MGEKFRFEPSLFEFLRDLKKNNERPWFQANKARYENELRGPMLRFIEGFTPHLEKISTNFLADPRPVASVPALGAGARRTQARLAKPPFACETHINSGAGRHSPPCFVGALGSESILGAPMYSRQEVKPA